MEVYHKKRDGGNGLDNAVVLCPECYGKKITYRIESVISLPFSISTKDAAFRRAFNRCECDRPICGTH